MSSILRRKGLSAGILLLCLVCAACTAGFGQAPQDAPSSCSDVYTYAPGVYIVDLAAGAEVVLDPSVHDFPLFCTPSAAYDAVDLGIANGVLPDGDWRVYRVEGDFDDLAEPAAAGGHQLGRMAPVVDWVARQEQR